GVVVELEEWRLLMFDQPRAASRGCAAAFRAYGIDVEALSPEEAAEHIRQRAVQEQLVAALDDWAVSGKDPSRHGPLMAITQQAAPDPWRNALRAAFLRRDIAALQKLADSEELATQPARALILLGNALETAGRDNPGATAARLRVLR